MAYTAWFEDLDVENQDVAGGKGANLGELTRAGFAVPRGFVVLADAYVAAVVGAGIRAELVEIVRAAGPDWESLEASSSRLQELVRKAGVPETVRTEVAA